MLRRIIDFVNYVVTGIAMVFLVVMTFLVVLQVFSRVIIGYSFAWTEEVVRFLLIWVTFLGAAVAFKYGAHISIDLLFNKLPVHLRKAAQWGITIICASFFMMLIVKGGQIVGLTMVQLSPTLQIPMGYIYMVIPFSGLLQFINLVDISIDFTKTGQLPREES